jgi:hypothetical protein
MLRSTGFVLAASGIVIANDIIVAPLVTGKGQVDLTNINWRIVPATAILALMLGGLEKLSEPLGAGLGALVLLSVLVVPVGKGPTPLVNAGNLFNKSGNIAKGGAL